MYEAQIYSFKLFRLRLSWFDFWESKRFGDKDTIRKSISRRAKWRSFSSIAPSSEELGVFKHFKSSTVLTMYVQFIN